jgi:hypothetical protein
MNEHSNGRVNFTNEVDLSVSRLNQKNEAHITKELTLTLLSFSLYFFLSNIIKIKIKTELYSYDYTLNALYQSMMHLCL